MKETSYPQSHIMVAKQDIDCTIRKITQDIKKAMEQSKKPIKLPSNPYILPKGLREQIRHRNHLRKNWTATRAPRLRTLYLAYSDYIRRLIREHKNDKWNAPIESLNTQDNSIWGMAKKLTRKKAPIPTLKVNGTDYVTDQEKADILAANYEGQFTPNQDSTDFHRTTNDLSRTVLTKLTREHDMNTAPIFKMPELRKIIKSLHNRKAPGYDQIPTVAIKKLPHNVLKEMLQIYNSCSRTAHFPEDWKQAIIKPIPKSGQPKEKPSSYSPISLLPHMSKIYECLLLQRLNTHIQDKKILQDEQFGFRSQHSTTHQLMRITEDCHRGFAVGAKTALIFIDVEKAFDKLWIEGLIAKCVNYDFPNWLILQVHTFLDARSYKVQVNNSLSTPKQIKAGVPQGSVLGPTVQSLHGRPSDRRTHKACIICR